MTKEQLEEFSYSMQEQMYALALLEIIRNNPRGIVVYTPSINDLCRDIYELTDVMVTPDRLNDEWEVENYYGETYTRTKPNPRKHQLTIKV